MSIGAVVVSSNTDHGGDLAWKFTYGLTSLISVLDQVYYIDWNSPGDKTLIDAIRHDVPSTGKLHVIVVTQQQARELTRHDPDAQHCCEVLARNIGLRRLGTNYLVSTNSDIMILSRENINALITDENTFYTTAKTNIEFSVIRDTHMTPGSDEVLQYGWNHKHLGFQYGDWGGDRWSLISGCGDFQVAHRNIWYTIRGFEESMIYRWYMDTNVQRKADFYGFKQKLLRDLIALHFIHYPGTNVGGGANNTKLNDPHAAMENFAGTTNPETWGFADVDFKEEII